VRAYFLKRAVQRARKHNRGQSTIEYILMVAFGAVFAIQVASFFNGVFEDGFAGLERNVQTEMWTGRGFGAE